MHCTSQLGLLGRRRLLACCWRQLTPARPSAHLQRAEGGSIGRQHHHIRGIHQLAILWDKAGNMHAHVGQPCMGWGQPQTPVCNQSRRDC